MRTIRIAVVLSAAMLLAPAKASAQVGFKELLADCAEEAKNGKTNEKCRDKAKALQRLVNKARKSKAGKARDELITKLEQARDELSQCIRPLTGKGLLEVLGTGEGAPITDSFDGRLVDNGDKARMAQQQNLTGWTPEQGDAVVTISGKPEIEGLDPRGERKAIVRIGQRLRILRHCYVHRLKKTTVKPGKVGLKLEVDARGRVTATAITLNQTGDDELSRCVLKRMKRWRWPKSEQSWTIGLELDFKQGPALKQE